MKKITMAQLVAWLKNISGASLLSHVPRRVESVWFMLLIAFGIALITISAWSVVLFLQVNTEEVSDTVLEGDPVETISRVQLETLLTTLEKRQATFNTLTDEAPLLEEPAATATPETSE